MFTLRKITSDNIETNTYLGAIFQVIRREENYEEFARTYESIFEKRHVADLDNSADNYSKDTYAFIITEFGKDVHPLYKKQFNYIVSESGKTFNNLTYK